MFTSVLYAMGQTQTNAVTQGSQPSMILQFIPVVFILTVLYFFIKFLSKIKKNVFLKSSNENGKKTVGGILILIGIICMFYGIIDLNSFSSQLAGTFGVANKNAIGIIIIGAILAVIGISMFFTMKPDLNENAQESKVDIRKCPYCAETIKYEALKCKHCGSALTPLK